MVELFVISGRPENVPQAFPYEEKWLKFDDHTREGIYKRVVGRTVCVPSEKWQRLDKYVFLDLTTIYQATKLYSVTIIPNSKTKSIYFLFFDHLKADSNSFYFN